MQIDRRRLDGFVDGLSTKSDKIRTLARNGVSTAEIARYLDIRYQHARNVLVHSGLHSSKPRNGTVSETVVREVTEQFDSKPTWVEVDGQGNVKLPINLLEAAGIRAGMRVHVRIEGDAIEILSQRAALKRAHDIVRKFVPAGVSLVDDLIAERRREAQREED